MKSKKLIFLIVMCLVAALLFPSVKSKASAHLGKEEEINEAVQEMSKYFLENYWLSSKEVSFDEFEDLYLDKGSCSEEFYREMESRFELVNKKSEIINEEDSYVLGDDLEYHSDFEIIERDDLVIVKAFAEKYYQWSPNENIGQSDRLSCDLNEAVFIYKKALDGKYSLVGFIDEQSSPEYLRSIDYIDPIEAVETKSEPLEADQAFKESIKEILEDKSGEKIEDTWKSYIN